MAPFNRFNHTRWTSVLSEAVLLLLLVVALPSCGWSPQDSLYPIYTDKDVTTDDRVLGVWVCEHAPGLIPNFEWKVGGKIAVRRGPGTDHYVLSTGAGDRPPDKSELHLVRIGKYLFADIEEDYPGSKPTHLFGRVFIARDTVTLRLLQTERNYPDKDWKLPLKTENGSVVEPTEKLQKFALQHAHDRKLFLEVGLCREGVADCDIAVPRVLLRQDPKNIDAGLRLATAYMNRGRYNEAWSTWKQIPPMSRGLYSLDSLFRASYLAHSLMAWGHQQNAITVLQARSQLVPQDREFCQLYAAFYLYVDRPQQVLAELQRCDALPPGGSAHNGAILRAMAYGQMGEFEKARAEASKPSADDREFAGIAPLTRFAQGDYANAEAEFAELPSGRTGMIWRYLTLRHLDKEHAASEFLKTSPPGDDKYVPALWGSEFAIRVTGWGSYLRGQIGDAQFLTWVHPRKGQYVQPEMCVAYFLVAEKHLLDGDRKGARKYFAKAVDAHAYCNAEWVIAKARLRQLANK